MKIGIIIGKTNFFVQQIMDPKIFMNLKVEACVWKKSHVVIFCKSIRIAMETFIFMLVIYASLLIFASSSKEVYTIVFFVGFKSEKNQSCYHELPNRCLRYQPGCYFCFQNLSYIQNVCLQRILVLLLLRV